MCKLQEGSGKGLAEWRYINVNLDASKIFRIGIDWLTLYNFEISYNSNLYITERVTEEFYQEKFLLDEPSYTLDSTTRLYADGKETNFKNLRLNPNRILNGHNVYNSRVDELKQALLVLIEELKQKGIDLNLSEAKIKDVEINLNINKPFLELKEALELIFVSTPHLKKISRYTGNKSYRSMFQDETLLGNYSSSLVTAYDKTEESKKLDVELDITRLEWRFLNKTFSYFAKSKELNNSLNTILTNFSLIDEIFIHNTRTRLIEKGIHHLERNLKVNLEREFIAFKKANKLGKELGKKEKRGVYRYLEEKCWIFDYSFLIELVDKYDKPHKTRETKTITKSFSNHNNLEKLNYLMEFIFNH